MTKILGIGILAFVLFYLEKAIYRRVWKQRLRVELTFAQDSLFEGEKGQLLEVVENRKRLSLPMLKVKFQTSRNLQFSDVEGSRVTDLFYRNDVFHIGGGERITRTLTFIAGKRGYYRIRGIDMVASDLFLAEQMVESGEADTRLHVYPRPFEDEQWIRSLRQLNGEILTKRHWLEDPFEYRGIREYQPFDDMRSVNWKATARTGELKVNQKNYTSQLTIRIFFNIEDIGILKKDECVEASFRIVAGLADFFLKQGMPVSCFGNGRDAVTGECGKIEASAGNGQMEQIYRMLARVDTEKGAEDFKECLGKRLLEEAAGTVTLLVAPNAYENFTGLLEEYRSRGQECIWFYPNCEKEEPEVPESLRDCVRVIDIREKRTV